ncbi:NlpC/P60 family protein [Limosilactobacillus reuteri]|uniref:NlpC/P60 family protein n=1 Tax=Limosilactobacillus reuteri TaxID=1598 RepID=UPI000F2DE28B|nr:NlpC/P60 family protein [Limosilactobacillus reuteri]RNF36926.1 hypothetical protein EAI06_02555 [Limosilactobacillus reuteri]
MEEQKHYKMFKKGKNWCYMAIATVAIAFGVSTTSVANADTTDTTATPVTSQQVEVSDQTATNDQSEVNSNQELQQNTTNNENQDTAPVAVTPQTTNSLNGWQQQDGSTYYYNNGQKATGVQDINGSQYYFNDQGQQQKDYFLNQDNHTYYFQADGTRLNDGFYNNWGHTYYFRADGSRLDNGFYNNWGHTYYFGNDGARLDNSVYSNWGHQYYFGNDGALVQNSDVTVSGKKYYADNEGILTEKNNVDTKVDRALSQRGVPYVWGGNTPAGFDCSGLVQWAYGLGSNYRTTYQQATLGTHQRDVMNAPKGSLLFFGSDSAPYHVAISLGNGTYVHAPEPGDVVKIGYSRYFKPSFFITL